MLGIHKSITARIKSWTHHHHIVTAVIAVLGLLIASAAVVWAVAYQSPEQAPKPQHNTVVKETPPPSPEPVYYSPLTGEKVPDKASTQQPVTGVMIENSVAARPQSGLKDSGVVFEAIAEGGITRFLVLYQQEKPQLIGPVRSLRLYDISWFAPFQASIAHVGGSRHALQEVRNGSYRDLDQFFNGNYYWRAKDRPAPHNVYTSFTKLDTLNAKRGFSTSSFISWPRQDGAPAKTADATTINVKISSATYNSQYTYNAEANNYTRSQAGAVHKDREKGPITPSVVIVMDVTETTVLEDGYLDQFTTTGTGMSHIFQNGTETDATWSKADIGSQLKFTDVNGKEIPLNRGQTWITAVPANRGGGVTWSTTN